MPELHKMKLLATLLMALFLMGCAIQFDPFNNGGNPKASPDVIKAIDALNQFAINADARLKALEPKPVPAK